MTQIVETSKVPRRWWALAALALSMLTIGLDATVLNVALPTLATELDASTSQLQWFSASYTLVLGALIIPMGSLGDRLGRKRLLLGGLAVFGASSAACAFASSADMLIAARAFQGVGGAAMMPLSMAMLPVLFQDREERTRAMNIWVTCSAIGLPLGPIVGGWLLNHFSWGAVFLINVPLVAVGLLALAVYLPETRSERTHATDGAGIALSSTGLVAVIYGLIEAGQDGWGSASVLAPILAGVALLAAFVVWQRRSPHPLIDLALFSNRDFTIGTALSTVANFALFGLLFVMPQYFQDVGGSDPLGTGVRLLPMIGGMIVATRIGPMLVRRAGTRFVIIAGLALSAIALGLAATTDVDTAYQFAAVWITLLGAGIGLTMPAAMTTAIGALSIERAGSGSGLIQALRQVGGTIGVAVLGTLLSSGYHAWLDEGDVPASAEEAVRSSVGAGIETAHQLGSSSLEQTVRSAFVHGMDTVLLASAALMIVGVVTALLCLPRRVAETPAPTASAPAADAEAAVAS
jgi:DHA2 family multidrug resistance protein-like MFS transporter